MQATDKREFTALPPVGDISAPHLTATEAATLLDTINGVRAGDKVYLVRLTNRKLTKPDGSYKHGDKREAGVDYVADPALAKDAHEGILYAAPTNKRGEVYLRLRDNARSPVEVAEADEDGDGQRFGWTCVSLEGLRSFRVLAEFDGPLAQPQPAGLGVGPQPFGGGFDPQTLMAQASILMAQAGQLQAQASALMAQAMMVAQAQAMARRS